MYVITGATGKTGATVAETLLERGQKVRVVVRSQEKGREWKLRGAEVVVADLGDVGKMTEALRGAEGVYLMIPPDYTTPDMLAAHRKLVDSLKQALQAARPKHVVLLSSVGAQHEAGNGPVRTLHYAEKTLQPDVSLRAAYFIENWGSLVGVAREQGILPSFLTVDRQMPTVATQDIGRTAAALLLEKTRGVVELAGPEDLSPAQIASALGKALGKPVNAIQVPEEGIVPALKQAGMSDQMAELFRELTVGINSGHVAWTQKPIRGRASLDETLAKLLK